MSDGFFMLDRHQIRIVHPRGGRAGRDGEAASCILYAERRDFDVLSERIERRFSDEKDPKGLSMGRQSVKCNVWRAKRQKTIFGRPNLPALKLLAQADILTFKNPLKCDHQEVTCGGLDPPLTEHQNDRLTPWRAVVQRLAVRAKCRGQHDSPRGKAQCQGRRILDS